MRQITRGFAPDDFKTDAKNWQEEFDKSQDKPGTFWTKVRKRKKIKSYAQELHSRFFEKCAFCESYSTHVSPLHIEHYYPKETYPEKMFWWENWLSSCQVCNTNKGAKFEYCEEQPCLINPAAEDPSEHLEFQKAFIFPKTARGKYAIAQIKLDRNDLNRERGFWLNTVIVCALLMQVLPETGILKHEIQEFLIWAMQPDAPYSMMTLTYLRELLSDLAHPNTPHFQIKPFSSQRLQQLTFSIESHLTNL